MTQQLDPQTLAAAQSYWSLFDQRVSEEASAGDANTLDQAIITSIWATTTTTLTYTDDVDSDSDDDSEEDDESAYHPLLLDLKLHSFWGTVLLAVQNWDAQNPKQDLVLRYILAAREMGVLPCKKKTKKKTKIEKVGEEEKPVIPLMTSSGQRLWIDLPYLIQDIYTSWRIDSPTMSSHKRRNLAAFVARLASVGVGVRGGDELMGIALLLFRDVFEIPQRLTASSADSGSGSGSEMSVEELLPAVAAWVEFAHLKLRGVVERSVGGFADAEAATSIGQLAASSSSSGGGIVQPGFSPSRWAFWKRRLAEMGESGRVPEASRILQVLTDHE